MTRRKAVAIVKPPVTWILVADSKQAQVYTRRKPRRLSLLSQFEEAITHTPISVPDMAWEAEPLDQYQLGRNATGMVFESKSSERHMNEPRIDAREEIQQRFAQTIVRQLAKAKTENRFDRLVLVAPPKMLGEIRKHLDTNLSRAIMAEMPKDLTHYDSKDLADHLGFVV